jgi:membrane fusion protein, heavy metal efflux system
LIAMNFDLQDNRTKLFAAAGGIALLAGLGGWWLGQSNDAASETTTEAEEGHAEEGEADHGPEGFVALTPAAAAASGIITEAVSPGTLASEIIAQASVTAPPEGRSSLTARADGAVVRIYKRLGDPVGAGETVALIESRDASAIAADRASAAARASAANAALNRERRLYAEKITARQDLEAAQAQAAEANAELRRTQAAQSAAGVTGDSRHIAVRSLIGGRITKADAELGAYVPAGTELFEVANPNRVQIEAAVSATDAARIRPGDQAVIELPGGSTLDATVRSTTPSLDPQSRTGTVVLSPMGSPPGLTQGQGVRVRITPRGSVSSGRIVVPEAAVQSVEGRDVIFVRRGEGFQAVRVTVGQRSSGRAEILAGIRPGTIVVTAGAFALKSQLGASEADEH